MQIHPNIAGHQRFAQWAGTGLLMLRCDGGNRHPAFVLVREMNAPSEELEVKNRAIYSAPSMLHRTKPDQHR